MTRQPADVRARATRYDVVGPLVYRRVGDDDWPSGRTVNMSSTGVLFVAGAPSLPEMTAVELLIDLPNPGARGCCRVRCLGRIARCRGRPPDPVSMAATIDSWELLRAGAAAPNGA